MSSIFTKIIWLLLFKPAELGYSHLFCLLVLTISIFSLDNVNAASAALGLGKSLDLKEDSALSGTQSSTVSGTLTSFSVRCPASQLIHPCDCVELEKGLETEFNENESLALSNDTSEEGANQEDEISLNPHPDLIETLVFCKHIYSRKQLMDSMKAFKGHRISYLIIDSCSIPPFPTNIFNQINILFMEVLNSTIQFHESFFECGANCL